MIMKNFKFLYLLLAVVGVVTFTSCTEKWTPGAKETNIGVYFPEVTAFEVSAEDTSVDITVCRNNTAEAASVSLRYEATDMDRNVVDFFTAPANVQFAAGEASTTLTVEFDATQFVIGELYTLTIKLDANEATAYGISEASFPFFIPEPWVSMGTGIYFDDFLCELFGEADTFRGLGAYVEFEQHGLEPNRIRVVNPFGAATLGAMWGGVPSWLTFAQDDRYLEFDITDPDHVRVGLPCEIGGEPAQLFSCDLHMPDGPYDIFCIVKDSTPIVLQDGIIKFPQGCVWLAAFQDGSLLGTFSQTANASGYFQFYLPGTEFVNYEINATYDGMYVSADGETAEAIFNFALGTDVDTYKFTFVTGDVTADPSAVAEAIVAGSEELEIFESDAETKTWQVELTKGVWTLVAVPYTVEGEARLQDTYALNFYFNGTGEMPEVEVDVKVGAPSSFAAEENKAAVEAETPACFYIGLNITANAADIKSMRAWWGTVASYESGIASGLTEEDILAGYAADLGSFLDKLAENGSVTVRVNVNNGYEYKVLFAAETIYGTTITWSGNYTTAEYNGALAVGEYAFADASSGSQMVFSLVPGKTYSDFYFVHNYIDGSMWYAKYDEATGTITNEGVERDYESYGSQWGMLYGAFNEDATQVYSYFSSTTADYAEMAPMVMTVADNAIAGLETYFGMAVVEYDPVNNVPGSMLGMYFNFTPNTQVAPASGALQARVQSVNAKFNAKAAQMEACEVHSVIASEPKVVINATPVARTFTKANLSF